MVKPDNVKNTNSESSQKELYKELIEKIKSDTPHVILRKLEEEGSMESMEKIILNPNELPEDLTELEEQIVLKAYFHGEPMLEKNKETGTYLFAEPFYPEERLIVLGGGHVAVPLVEFASTCGFKVTVVDDRPYFANSQRFPKAAHVVCESFEKYLSELDITSFDYIVLVTRGHRYDLDCLRQIFLKSEPRYLGMIGSKRRVSVIKDKLLEEGVDKKRLSKMYSPIGLKIGAKTPEEIGISIVAELIKKKRVDLSDEVYVFRSDADLDVIYSLPNKTEGVSLVTIIKSNGSVPRGAGASMTVTRDRRIIGSIGGGCSESEIIVTASQNVGSSRYFIQKIDLSGTKAEDEGMVCGGNITVLVEDIS